MTYNVSSGTLSLYTTTTTAHKMSNSQFSIPQKNLWLSCYGNGLSCKWPRIYYYWVL